VNLRVQAVRDRPARLAVIAKPADRRKRWHAQSLNANEIRNEHFGQTIGDVRFLRITGQVANRQNGDRQRPRGRRRRGRSPQRRARREREDKHG
jgi:hypothetical protein